MRRAARNGFQVQLFSKPLSKIALALGIGLLIPLIAIYAIGEMRKEHELQKELEALSFQNISPYKDMLEELFLDIDQKTLRFSTTTAIEQLTRLTDWKAVTAQLRAAHREIAELTGANCCDDSVEIYYQQTGFIKSIHSGKEAAVLMSDDQWEAYKTKLIGKSRWFVDEKASESAGSLIISLIRPIPSVGNQPQGMIKINFNTSLFQVGYKQPEGQAIWAVTPDGNYMFDLETGQAVQKEQVVNALRESPHLSGFLEEEGETYGYRLFPSSTSGWSFVLRLPPSAFTSANSAKWVIYAVCLLLTLAAGFYVLRRFTTVVQKVESLVTKEEEFAGKLKELLPALRQHCLQKLLLTDHLHEDECLKKLKECSLAASNHGYAVILLRIEDYEHFLQYSYRDQSLYRFFITKAAEEIAENDQYVMKIYDSGERDVALLYWIKSENDASPVILKQQAERLLAVLRKYLPLRISAGIGGSAASANRIYMSYQQALQTLDDHLFLGNSGVFIHEEQAKDNLHSMELYSKRKEMETTIGKAILSRDSGLLERTLNTLEQELEHLPGHTLSLVRHIFWELVMYIQHRVQEAGLKLTDTHKLRDLHAQIEKLESLSAIVLWTREISYRWIEELQLNCGTGRVNITSQIIDYVHANFDKEISLGGIADQMGLDTAYVSRCFKQEVGMTFMDYLLTLRIKHAKYLLSKPHMNVNEIAQAVGYVNVNSFIRIFKKHEGLTPGQYRDLNHPRELDFTQVY